MRVQFDATVEDMVDSALRATSRSRTHRSTLRTDYVGGMLLTGLFSGIAVYLLMFPEVIEARLLVASLAAVAGAAVYPFLHQRTIKRRLRRYYREMLGGDTPFHVQVELTAEGVCTKQLGAQNTIAWSHIEAIREASDSIDIHSRHGGIVVVRRRAFDSEEAVRRFLEVAESYRIKARQIAER